MPDLRQFAVEQSLDLPGVPFSSYGYLPFGHRPEAQHRQPVVPYETYVSHLQHRIVGHQLAVRVLEQQVHDRRTRR
jgi:hypothetical protein